MKKLSLTVIGMYLSILQAFSQEAADTAAYKPRKLTVDEINFVSGYYSQGGNHSAVTGGTGTEALTDIANTFELRLFRYDARGRKHSLGFELGIDHYTSASSDKIDPSTISSPSYSDLRIYPSLSWSVQNEAAGTTVGLHASFSREYDYTSFGIGALYTKASGDKNRELSLQLQAYLDRWKVIYPVELRSGMSPADGHAGFSPRNSFSATLSLSQVVNPDFQLLVLAEPTYQSGLLATRYQRVYFTSGGVQAENLPGTRFKLPLGLRASYFLGDRLILRGYYRYYSDNWAVRAHTAELEVPYKITPFFSLTPFYRYYSQTAADYFAPYGQHLSTETYFTSDYDLSAFDSHFFGGGFRLAPPSGVLGIQHLNALELRYGRYLRSDGLHANQLSLHLKFK